MIEILKDPDCLRTFKRFLGLPFLPHEKIIEVMRKVVELSNPSTKKKLKDFFTYFQNQWIKTVKPAGFSIFGLDTRNTNILESFNAILLRIIGKDPDPWTFVGKYFK